MILADKIINLRKKNGWSQEELAEKIGVTRQSVSKWEGALSAPDLEKIIQLSQAFGVSTDYLLKDDMEDPEFTESVDEPSIKRVSLTEANQFLSIKSITAKLIAMATFLCVLAPVCLLVLGAAVETGRLGISEPAALGIGLSVMFVLVATAVAVFIACGMKTKDYQYLEIQAFETEYGVTGMVKDRCRKYEPTYRTFNIVGTCLCILSVLPLLIGACLTNDDFYMMLMLAATIIIAGIGAVCFIVSGINHAATDKLLQEGDYTKKKKEENNSANAVAAIYWPIVTAGYLAWSFISGDWGTTWIVWPIAGVLFAAVSVICRAFTKNK